MGKEWDKKSCWKQWVEEEQTSIYSLAFFLTGERSAAVRLTGQAIASAYRSYQTVSKAGFLETVAGNMCRLYVKQEGNRFPFRDWPQGEAGLIVDSLLQLEGELRLVVVYHYLLKVDREALAHKLEWPQEKLNFKLNQALGKLQNSFLAQGLIQPN